MTTLEIIIGLIGAGGLGTGAISLIKQWQRDGRAKRLGDAKVQIAEIGADTKALEILADQIDDLRKAQKEERDECKRESESMRAAIENLREGNRDCEKRYADLQRQLNRLRTWMRSDPGDREDLTPVEGLRETKGR